MLKFRPMINPVRLSIARHPIFRLERRRVHWAAGNTDYLPFAVRWVGLSCLLIVGFSWLAEAVAARNSVAPYPEAWQGDILILAFGLVSLAGLLLDFACLVLAGGAINREITSGRWILLCLTPLSDESIMQAKHAGVRLRCWPWLHVLVGMRCGIGVLLVLWGLDELRYVSALEAFLVIGLFMLAVVPYVIEPFWRIEAMTTAGLFFSTLNRTTTLTVLTAALGLFALWLAQAVFVGSVSYAVLLTLNALYESLTEFRGLWVTFLFTGLTVGCFWLLNYGFYEQLERRSWRRLLRRLARFDV